MTEITILVKVSMFTIMWIKLNFILPKKHEDVSREEGIEGRRGSKQEVETQAQTVLTLGLDQITKFIYRLDGPLGESSV
jgi:hypothetical protein